MRRTLNAAVTPPCPSPANCQHWRAPDINSELKTRSLIQITRLHWPERISVSADSQIPADITPFN